MAFEAYEVSILLAEALTPIVRRIETRDTDLAKQLRRAAGSVVQSISEANKRVKADRANRFRWAGAEASEVKGSLRLAVAFDYMTRADIDVAHELADRVCAMAYVLANK